MAMLKVAQPAAAVAHKPWWCRHCHAFVDVIDAGEAFPQCEQCDGRSVKWAAADAVVALGPVATVALPQWPEPQEPRKAQQRHRLAPEKRDLMVLARTGYWFCYGDCEQITEANEEECCVLCGAALHLDRDWVKPAFQPDEGQRGC